MRLATIISRVFEPLVVLAAVATLSGVKAGFVGTELVSYLTILLIAFFVPVVGFRLWFVRVKNVDWDIRDRKKRLVPLLILLAFTAIIYPISTLWRNFVISSLFGLLFVWTVGFSVITMVWKISGHASVAAFATGLIIQWFGWGWWPVLLTVPLVGWARVARRDHTVGQVIAGALYSWGLVLLFR